MLFFCAIAMVDCEPKNTKKGMEQEQKELIELCKEFARIADSYEERANNNGEYRLKGFYPNFNTLFEKYAHGKQNRTISGLNFRNPPRYSEIKNAVKETVTPLSENKYQVTFVGEPKFKSLRFTVAKMEGVFKLLYYETYIGIAQHGDNEGKAIWRKQKL